MSKGSSIERAFFCAFAVCVCVSLGVAPATAQSNIAAAAKAFSLAQQAELAGNHRAASEHYELADRMVPSPEALRSAARARQKAGDEAMAATHAEALQRRYTDEKSREVAQEILTDLRPKLARVTLACARPCGVVVDGGAIGVEESRAHVFYVEQGRHTIGADFGDNVTEQEVFEAKAGKSASLSIAPAEAEAATAGTSVDLTSPSRPPPAKGISRGWFVASAAVTVGLAGASIWSGLDVLSKNDEYERDPTQARLDAGQSAELRTNILIGATAVAAVATGVIAWKTRWSSPKREQASTLGLVPSEGGALVVLGGHFQ
jgi:hypothetical protein